MTFKINFKSILPVISGILFTILVTLFIYDDYKVKTSISSDVDLTEWVVPAGNWVVVGPIYLNDIKIFSSKENVGYITLVKWGDEIKSIYGFYKEEVSDLNTIKGIIQNELINGCDKGCKYLVFTYEDNNENLKSNNIYNVSDLDFLSDLPLY